jgi:hypothetical protein
MKCPICLTSPGMRILNFSQQSHCGMNFVNSKRMQMFLTKNSEGGRKDRLPCQVLVCTCCFGVCVVAPLPGGAWLTAMI